VRRGRAWRRRGHFDPAVLGSFLSVRSLFFASCTAFFVNDSLTVMAVSSTSNFGEISYLMTVKTLTGMATDVYPRENCIAPAIALIVWTTNTKVALSLL